MSASLNTIRCLGEEQIYSYGWRAVTFLCGVVVREVPDGDPAVGRRAPAGGHPQVPLRQHPRRRHRPLLRRHLPLPLLLLLLPPCTTHEDTRKSGRNQITAESSGIKSERAARAQDDPGGAGRGRTCGDRRRRGGGGRRGSHPGRGVSAARRGRERRASERAREEEGSARAERGEGEFLLLFIALTPRCDG